MRPMTLQRAGTWFGVVMAAGLLMGAGPVRIDAPITGQVTDVDTNAPIQGALVRLEQVAACPRLHGSTRHRKPPREILTDADGRFVIGGGVAVAPCPFARWSMRLDILAPGYLTAQAFDTEEYITAEPSVRSGTFELDPRGEAGSRWSATLAAARSLPARPVGRLGVFATQPGAVFDRVATVERGQWRRLLRWNVIAQDRTTGTLYAWTTKGTVEPVPAVPAGAAMLAGRRSYPNHEPWLVQPGHFYLLGNRPIGPGSWLAPNWVPVAAQFGGVRAAARWGLRLVTLEGHVRRAGALPGRRGLRRRDPGCALGLRPAVSLAGAVASAGATVRPVLPEMGRSCPSWAQLANPSL